MPEFSGKIRAPEISPLFCATLRSRHTHGHVTRTILYENYHGKRRAPGASKTHAADFVRACAVEVRMDIAQEHFTREFTGKMLGSRWSTLIKQRSLRLNPSVWTRCLGKNPDKNCYHIFMQGPRRES